MDSNHHLAPYEGGARPLCYITMSGGEYWDRTSRAKGAGFTVQCITIDASSPLYGAGLRNRTSINDFGDRCNAIIPDRHGGWGWIRTNDVNALQALALDHSATQP